MNKELIKEIKEIIKSCNLNCSVKEFKDNVNWRWISTYQKLSEPFIRKFKGKVDWHCISIYQKLSEPFIREFKDNVYWYYISKYQNLSEPFIKEFKDNVCWDFISKYQKLSEPFIKEFNLKIDNKTNTLYWSLKKKLNLLKKYPQYEIIDNKYIIAYKGIRSDRYSNFNFQYKYEVGETYTSHCDCNLNEENSFGLSAWTEEKAKEYCSKLVIKVKINIEDIGAIVHNGGKIRCKQFEVIS